MKAFALAVVAAAGLLCSAGTADAQFRSRGSYRTYSYPTYSYPTYSYPTYTSVVPTYTSVVPTYDNGVVVTSGYTPAYTAPVYPSGSYYPSSFGSYPSYYSGYSGYSGTYVSPYGYMGGRRGWRW